MAKEKILKNNFVCSSKQRFNVSNRRYIGSKANLSDWIINLIKKECSGNSFIDLFAGTGIITKKASDFYKKVLINDILYSNNIIYRAFFEEGEYSLNKLESYIIKYNNLNSQKLKNNYFSNNFGGKFFNLKDSKKIGYIREDIENNKNYLTVKEYNILLASLLYSIDRISNTVGHYEAYFQKNKIEERFIMNLISQNIIDNVEIYREDSNALVKKIEVDIVYIDPPYNSRQYSRFYHLLETLVKWDKPELFGVALKPKEENMSEYCKAKANIVFEDLIRNIKARYIVVSYNNTYVSKSSSSKNKISLGFIENVLEKRGATKIFSITHKFFNTGKTEFNDHKEYLFITEVKK